MSNEVSKKVKELESVISSFESNIHGLSKNLIRINGIQERLTGRNPEKKDKGQEPVMNSLLGRLHALNSEFNQLNNTVADELNTIEDII